MKNEESSKKYTFFIEGGDNVGKTTTIERFKSCTYIDKLNINRISFSKYPTYNMIDYLNQSNRLLKQYLSDNDIDNYTELNSEMISKLISDMKVSFSKDKTFPELGDILNISDRGPLSTYMYQYKAMLQHSDIVEDINDDKNNFIMFLLSYLTYDHTSPDYPVPSIVILNNNKPDIQLSTSEEVIEYKKEFDKDTELQNRVNNTLSNIINLLNTDNTFANNVYQISNIKFYYINIYDEDGKRKTTHQVTTELLNIVNNRISEHRESINI